MAESRWLPWRWTGEGCTAGEGDCRTGSRHMPAHAGKHEHCTPAVCGEGESGGGDEPWDSARKTADRLTGCFYVYYAVGTWKVELK